MIVAQPQEHHATGDLCQRLQAEARQSGTAFLADDVGGIVVILIVRLHDVEYHRLRLVAAGAPNSGKPR